MATISTGVVGMTTAMLSVMAAVGATTQALPQVVLYCDVNGTVTCKDSLLYSDDLKLGALHPGLLIDIARNAEGVWQEGLPSMLFVQYIEKHKYPLAPGLSQEEERTIEAKREAAYKEIFSCFTPEQAKFWQEKYQEGLHKLQEMDRDGHKKVFRSFIQAIQWLKSENKRFQVLLRTYGSDALVVMEEVNRELKEPFFDGKTHKLTYAEDGQFLLQLHGASTAEKVSRVALSSRLAQLGNSAVRDDYNAWHAHGEVGKWGKPYPIDPAQESYFLDDWEGANTTIAPFDAKSGKDLPVDSGHLPPISTFTMLLQDESIAATIKETRSKQTSIHYTNWRGETADREIIPKEITFGSTEWHKEPQWLLSAMDLQKNERRDFALKDIDSWKAKEKPYPLFASKAAPMSMTKTPRVEQEKVVQIRYTNWRNETADRQIVPVGIYFGCNEWHKEPQWLLSALDVEKNEMRNFALKDIVTWKPKKERSTQIK